MILISCNQQKNSTTHDFEVGGIYYKIVDDISNEVKVTYKGNDWKAYSHEYSDVVVIPDKLTYEGKTYTVTEIDDYAFSGCTMITSIACLSTSLFPRMCGILELMRLDDAVV